VIFSSRRARRAGWQAPPPRRHPRTRTGSGRRRIAGGAATGRAVRSTLYRLETIPWTQQQFRQPLSGPHQPPGCVAGATRSRAAASAALVIHTVHNLSNRNNRCNSVRRAQRFSPDPQPGEAAWMTPRPASQPRRRQRTAPNRNPSTGVIDHRATARQLTHPLDYVCRATAHRARKHRAASPIDRRRDNRTRVHIQTNTRTLSKKSGPLHNRSERPSTEPRSVTHEICLSDGPGQVNYSAP